jgi:hypothetical protein
MNEKKDYSRSAQLSRITTDRNKEIRERNFTFLLVACHLARGIPAFGIQNCISADSLGDANPKFQLKFGNGSL